DVLGRGPTGNFTRQFYSDKLGELQLPSHTGHNIYGIRSSYPYGHHSQSTCINGMGIGPDHHSPWEGIVFQNYLMDNARSRSPKSQSVLIGNGFQEIKDFRTSGVGNLQIGYRPAFRLYKMITMGSSGHGHLGFSRLHK